MSKISKKVSSQAETLGSHDSARLAEDQHEASLVAEKNIPRGNKPPESMVDLDRILNNKWKNIDIKPLTITFDNSEKRCKGTWSGLECGSCLRKGLSGCSLELKSRTHYDIDTRETMNVLAEHCNRKR